MADTDTEPRLQQKAAKSAEQRRVEFLDHLTKLSDSASRSQIGLTAVAITSTISALREHLLHLHILLRGRASLGDLPGSEITVDGPRLAHQITELAAIAREIENVARTDV